MTTNPLWRNIISHATKYTLISYLGFIFDVGFILVLFMLIMLIVQIVIDLFRYWWVVKFNGWKRFVVKEYKIQIRDSEWNLSNRMHGNERVEVGQGPTNSLRKRNSNRIKEKGQKGQKGQKEQHDQNELDVFDVLDKVDELYEEKKQNGQNEYRSTSLKAHDKSNRELSSGASMATSAKYKDGKTLFGQRNGSLRNNARRKVISFLGSGGHTSEMMTLLKSLTRNMNADFHLVAADERSKTAILNIIPKHTDSIPEYSKNESKEDNEPGLKQSNIHESKENNGLNEIFVYLHESLPRARNVKQSWKSTPITAFYSLLKTSIWYLISFYKVDVVVLNGPGTCVMLVFALWLEWILTGYYPKVYYVESVARVQSLSLSGKILYHSRSCSRFFVQWKELQARYPRAEYVGRLC